MKKKRVISLILTAAMCLSLLVGCGNSSDSNDSSQDSGNTSAASETFEGDVVRVGVADSLTTLGPFEANTTARNAVLNCIYQPLFQIYKGEVLPVIGESYEYLDSTDGGATYPVRVTIKQGVTDSEGNPFTASDAKFSIEYAEAHGFDEKSKYVNGIELVDDYTLDVIFNVDASSMAGFFGDFACNLYMITEKAFTESTDSMVADPVGTGPYKLEKFVSGSSCTLVKDENFWQAGADDLVEIYGQNIDEIEFQFITDNSQIAIALQSGTIDISNGVTTTDMKLFEEGGQSANDFNVNQMRANKTYYILFNCSEESEASNLNLRLALSHCWDAQGLIDGAFTGKGYRVYAMEGHPGYSDYVEAWEDEDYFEYDEELAKEYLNKYLEETGKTASQVTIRLLGDSGQIPNSGLYELFQGYVENVLGVKCEIKYYESAVATDEWADPTAWDIYLSRAASTTNCVAAWVNRLSRTTSSWGTSTMGFVDDDKLEDLLMTAWAEDTHTDENVSAVRDYVNEQCYMVGICGDYENIVSVKGITNVVVDKKNVVMPGACEYAR